jgi:hypothetical protein
MENIIAVTKRRNPCFKYYQRLNIGQVRQIATPIPVCEMSGDEWDLMLTNWVNEIQNELHCQKRRLNIHQTKELKSNGYKLYKEDPT